MELQNKIIKQFYEVYPKATYREISEMTGIQMTRVFRVVNGKKMKLSEYEAFSMAIVGKSKDETFKDFMNLAQTCFERLSHESINTVCQQLQRKLVLASFKGGIR